ncbi:LysR family transcriptional regulator, partial [Burkholderia sp. SIMBA_013]
EDWQLDPMPLYIAFPPNRHVSAKLRVFIDWVAELMAEHAPPGFARLPPPTTIRQSKRPDQ